MKTKPINLEWTPEDMLLFRSPNMLAAVTSLRKTKHYAESIATIAQDTGIEYTRLTRAIADLERIGVVKTEPHGRGKAVTLLGWPIIVGAE